MTPRLKAAYNLAVKDQAFCLQIIAADPGNLHPDYYKDEELGQMVTATCYWSWYLGKHGITETIKKFGVSEQG